MLLILNAKCSDFELHCVWFYPEFYTKADYEQNVSDT